MVNQELEIISLQYTTTERLLKRFELVDNLPEYFKEQMEEIVDKMRDKGSDPEYLEKWQPSFENELKER